MLHPIRLRGRRTPEVHDTIEATTDAAGRFEFRREPGIQPPAEIAGPGFDVRRGVSTTRRA